MDVIPLMTPNVEATIDKEAMIARIVYKEKLDAAVTAQVYQWMNAMMTMFQHQIMVKQVIFDFRQVTEFDMASLAKARTENQQLRQSFDFSWIPAALWVANEHQEHMVGLSLKASGQAERSRIVHNEEEIAAFFSAWWETHAVPPTIRPTP